MFDGMPEQFYQFLAAATTASRTTTPTNNITTLPLSFTLHNNNNAHHHHHHHFPTTYSSHSQQQQQQQQPSFDAPFQHLLHHPHHLHFLPRTGVKDNDEDDEEEANLDLSHQNHSADLPIQSAAAALHEGSHHHHHHHQRSLTMLLPEIPWSNDEMLALFRIRSSMDNTWFPDFIWENVSRKLAELGFKRSAEKCKQKFEEETSSFNSSIISSNCNNKNNNNNHNNNNNAGNTNNYRLFGELEELCNNNANITINNGDNNHHHQQQNEALLPPPLPLDDRDDHLPQTSLSKDECLGGGNEEEDDNEDGGDDLGVDDEEEETGVVRLGDGEEGDDDQARNEENNMNNVVEEDEHSVDDDSEKTEENTKRVTRKRKRQKKFDMFKGFCEKIVNEMMAQQQQLHCKILQDMIKRDEEKIAKEEAWKRQEIERLEKELEIRAHEQAIAGDRQAKIFDCLKEFNISSSSTSNIVLDTQALKDTLEKLNKVPNMITSSNSSIFSQDSIMSTQLQPTSSSTTHDDNNHTPLVNHQACSNIPSSSSNENLALLSCVGLENSKLAPPMSSSSMDQPSQNPNKVVIGHDDDLSRARSVVSSSNKFSRSDHTSANATELVKDFKSLEKQNDVTPVVGHGKDDTGRRWPRDEVLALINIRCSLFSNNNNGGGDNAHNDKESYSKGPLWERISQKMMELGYKRSAKRCKEKWENINKYFRKTKDMNKKRSIDSRTCPYFHQLSHLYSQGALVGPTDRPISDSPENNKSMGLCGTQQQGGGSSSTPANNGGNNTMHTSQGNDEGVVQVAGFDFEF